MAGSRTLKLSILADVDNLKKNLDSGSKEVQTFGDKVSNFGKVAGAAFLAAGVAAAAYAGKLAIDGVKAAIEDEAAQLRLATSLKNVTGATEAQIKATEDYILKTSLATGVTDDELRPSLDRLVRSTGDVRKAQELQTLALDIAAGTGKSLSAVSEALAKAHDGNFTALKKLGGGIDENIIKSKDFTAATLALSNTFKDQASIQADTFEGKMSRLKVAFDEGKETVGGYILTAITPMVETIVNQVIPAISGFADGIGTKLGPIFTTFFEAVKSIAIPIFEGLKSIFDKVKTAINQNSEGYSGLLILFKAVYDFTLKYLAPIFGTTLKVALQVIGTVVASLISAFGKFLSVIKAVFDKITDIVDLIRNNPIIKGLGNLVGNIGSSSVPTPSVSSPKSSNASMTNITVNGAIDPTSTARQIANILNIEATQSGNFNILGTSRLIAVS
jgi:hypothetical protein